MITYFLLFWVFFFWFSLVDYGNYINYIYLVLLEVLFPTNIYIYNIFFPKTKVYFLQVQLSDWVKVSLNYSVCFIFFQLRARKIQILRIHWWEGGWTTEEKVVDETENGERSSRRRSRMGSWADVALFKDCCVIKARRTEAWPIFSFWSVVRDSAGGLLRDNLSVCLSVSSWNFQLPCWGNTAREANCLCFMLHLIFLTARRGRKTTEKGGMPSRMSKRRRRWRAGRKRWGDKGVWGRSRRLRREEQL